MRKVEKEEKKNVHKDTFVYSHYFSKSDSGNSKSERGNINSKKMDFVSTSLIEK